MTNAVLQLKNYALLAQQQQDSNPNAEAYHDQG